MNTTNCFTLLAAVLVTSAIGCGKSDNVTVYPVKGTVMFNGKPMLGGGSIAFIPTTSQKGKAAGGTILEDGSFVMTTYREGDGSMPGTFRVIVTQSVYQEPENTGDSDGTTTVKPKEPIAEVDKADRIPMIYADGVNSPATVTIEAKPNDLTIELENAGVQRGA
ncbi:MAG: hypothetical protein SH850_03300 [Planctomycetaceae bacterium]|nr:hypothetical protein [Planctomycetaceae bacterium]